MKTSKGSVIKNLTIILICLVILAYLTGNKSEENVSHETSPEPTVNTNVSHETSEPEPAEESIEDQIATIIGEVQRTLSYAYDDSDIEYSTDYDIDTKTLMVNITTDGLADGVAMILSGNDELLNTWNYMEDSVNEFGKQFYDRFSNSGHEDVTVLINILNDTQKDKSLLSSVNGETFYSVLTESTN